MARARNIKPGFFTNDALAEINPLGRLLFAGLWTIADRAGRLEDRPKKIKAEVLPFDNCNVEKLLGELATHSFIVRYKVDGVGYIQIKTWEKHQNPHVKEANSTIPAPGEHRANTVQSTVQAPEIPERAGLIPDSLNLIPDYLDDATLHDSAAYDHANHDDRLTAAPLPPREEPPVSNDPAIQIAVALRLQGVNVTFTHPAVQDWATKGVTIAMLTEAVATARMSKGTGNIPANYLVPIVHELLNPPAAVAPAAARQREDWTWKKSNQGIEAKGREIGMFARGGESYHDFASRIQTEIDKRRTA